MQKSDASIYSWNPWVSYYCAFVIVGLCIAGGISPADAQSDVPGYYQIDSIPLGADVVFDGHFVGETPATVTISGIGVLEHTVSISMPGYATWTRTYPQNPTGGQIVYISATLTPQTNFGSIVVTSSPTGALATIDGGKGQITPWTYTGLQSGPHIVQVFLSGYTSYSETVEVPPGGTARVNAVLTPLQNVGSIQVISSPGGADLYIDGVYRGVTATTVGNLIAGDHNMRLRLSGYRDYTETVTVTSGRVTVVKPTLVQNTQPETGDIQVSSSPAGASIYLDNTFQGITQSTGHIELTGIAPGPHQLVLTLDNYQDYSSSVQVMAGQVTVIAASLTPSLAPHNATLQVTSDPVGADVFLDNFFSGITPVTLQSVPPGSHLLLIKLSGYNDHSTVVNLTSGQSALVSVALTPRVTPTPTTGSSLSLAVCGAFLILALLSRARK
jgi:hypothetical protein